MEMLTLLFVFFRKVDTYS